MKFNKWTLGLAAVGVVSLASAAKADEKISRIQTAMSSTTISGYVDTSAQWNFGTGNANMPPYSFGGTGKADGFNLNVVQLSISQPLDESEWASGYKVDLWFGPDGGTLGTDLGGADNFGIRQAYVALRTPLGNGIDWKVGVFDTIIGYESIESGINPNFTRSYGHTLEPTTHTGVLGTYRFTDEIAVSAGVADTVGPVINGRAFTVPPTATGDNQAESYKTYMGSVALTAPESMGFLAGSTLYAGVINGFSGGGGLAGANGAGNQTSWYVGGTLATPVAGLKLGIAYDYYDSHRGSADAPATDGNDANAIGLYASYQATEKLSLHARGELASAQTSLIAGKDNTQIWAFTATAQYDLWQNVISRVEFRWDHGDEGEYFGGTTPGLGGATLRNAFMVAANIIYKF
jgi:hypothetical protein